MGIGISCPSTPKSISGTPSPLTFYFVIQFQLNQLIQVGPILPLELKQIPDEIVTWLNENEQPIIYFCMGTVVTISAEMAEVLV